MTAGNLRQSKNSAFAEMQTANVAADKFKAVKLAHPLNILRIEPQAAKVAALILTLVRFAQ